MTDLTEHNKKNQGELWRDLAGKAQAGDKRAYTKLLSEIFPYIRNTIIRGLANPEWAEDIAQDVLISVHKSLKTYSTDRPFKPWLMAITRFRKTDFLRKHYNTRQDKQTDLDNLNFQRTHVTNPDYAGELKDIEAALNSLPEGQRRIFTMIKIEGHSAKEVANEMGMSVSAVKVSAHRTQKKLQGKMEQKGL